MVEDSWFSECYWSDLGNCSDSSSIGIQINGNDHYLSSVIVFDYANVGVEVNGAANVLRGVHTWNGGGIGIRVTAYQNRLLGCYLDYNTLRLETLDQIVVDGGFFLSTNVEIAASGSSAAGNSIFRHNTYAGLGGPSIALIDAGADYSATAKVVVEDEIGSTVATRARLTATFDPGEGHTFDFTDMLLFPFINETLWSMSCDADDVTDCAVVARKPKGCTVEFVPGTAAAEAGSSAQVQVTVEVSQT